MKTKLTLTVNKAVIDQAKKIARQRKVSVSKLFEEVFEGPEPQPLRTDKQKSASALIKLLDESPAIRTKKKHDKALIKKYVSGKYS